MATVTQVAIASLNQINILEEAAPIEPYQIEQFIFALNNYMLALDATGVKLGYTLVDSADDTVTVPTGALRGVIFNMAVESGPTYDVPLTQELNKLATAGLKAMRFLGQTMGDSYYPVTLPVGSGNEHDTGFRLWSHFYDFDLENEILAETTGSISQETNTGNAST